MTTPRDFTETQAPNAAGAAPAAAEDGDPAVDIPIEVEGEEASAGTPAAMRAGAQPPALPLPLCRVRRAADAWLDEVPEESRAVLEAVRQGRKGTPAARVTTAV